MAEILADITHAAASENILRHVEAGTLTQGQWHGLGDDGREIACLLGAIHPRVREAADCNGALMPMWFAEMTPTLFDGIPADQIYPIARRYGELVGRWHVLSPAIWDAILTRVLIRCVDDAVSAAQPVSDGKTYWPAVAAACGQVKKALESGDADALSAAESAAASAAESAAASAARSAASAAWSARSAAESARSTARSAKSAAASARSVAASAAWSARSAAWSARSAAWSARSVAASAAWSARSAAWSAAWSAAYLSLFNFVLDQIESECVSAEAA